jgi:PAS domain S-box-containing protein
VLEFDLQGFIINANEVALNLFKYDRDALIGKHYNHLLMMEEADDDTYKLRWRQLKGGKYEAG